VSTAARADFDAEERHRQAARNPHCASSLSPPTDQAERRGMEWVQRPGGRLLGHREAAVGISPYPPGAVFHLGVLALLAVAIYHRNHSTSVPKPKLGQR